MKIGTVHHTNHVNFFKGRKYSVFGVFWQDNEWMASQYLWNIKGEPAQHVAWEQNKNFQLFWRRKDRKFHYIIWRYAARTPIFRAENSGRLLCSGLITGRQAWHESFIHEAITYFIKILTVQCCNSVPRCLTIFALHARDLPFAACAVWQKKQ